MRAQITGAIVAFASALSASGCLPLGTPPEGRHVLSGRADTFVIFQPVAAAGEPARLLTLRRSHVAPTAALGVVGTGVYAISEPPAGGGVADARLLLDDINIGSDQYGGTQFPADARGRPFFARIVRDPAVVAQSGFVTDVVRIDLATDARKDYGLLQELSFSPDRTRVLTRGPAVAAVHDLDDHETPLPATMWARFVGDDVFLVSTDGQLLRLRGPDATAPPEVAASDVQGFVTIATARGPLLLLERTTPNPSEPPALALYDVTASRELPLPGAAKPSFFAPTVIASPSGRYLLVNASSPDGSYQSTLWDRDTDTLETQTELQGDFTWRPGHDEIWIQAYSGTGAAGVWIWRPGQAPVLVVHAVFAYTDISDHDFAGRPFTPDGHFWLSSETDGTRALRSTDDPAAEPFPLNTSATGVSGYWPLADGRGISEVYTTYQFHCDISLVDPVARTSKALASNGFVVAAGAHRILTLLNYVKGSSSGDLTLIDLDTGEAKLLSENVFFVALERPRPALDSLPAGARVAYLVHNRIASPYDGLWVMTLP